MTTTRTRLALAGTGALALVMAVAGIAGAQGTTPGGATNGFGLGIGQGDAQGQARGMGHGEMGHGEMGGRHGGPGDMDGDHGMGAGPLDPFMDGSTIVRQETIVELAGGTFATRRLEHGTVTEAAADAITFTLATGEAVTVTIDADTVVEEAPAFAGGRGGPNGDAFGRGWTNGRNGGQGRPPMPAAVDPASIAVGATVMVASEAQADGSWLAHEVHVLPDLATEVPAPDASLAPASNG